MAAVWGIKLTSSPAAPPAFDAEQAYVPLDTGDIVAVSLNEGTVRWKARLETQVRLAAGGGLVHVASGEALHALAAADGRPVWLAPIGGLFSAPLVWDEGWLIAAMESGEVVAVNARTGDILWRLPVGSPVRRAPLIAGPHVYLAPDDGRIVALDIVTGKIVWERRLRDVAADMIAVEDRLFVGSRDNFFYCLSTKDGQERWRQRTGADILGAPALDEKRVYVVSLDGLLRAYDRNHGAQVWKQPFPARPSSGPILAGEVVLLPGVPPELRAYARKDGKTIATYTAPNLQPGTLQVLAAPPALLRRPDPEGRTLFLLTAEGQFFAVRRTYETVIEPLKVVPGVPVPIDPPPAAAPPAA